MKMVKFVVSSLSLARITSRVSWAFMQSRLPQHHGLQVIRDQCDQWPSAADFVGGSFAQVFRLSPWSDYLDAAGIESIGAEHGTDET